MMRKRTEDNIYQRKRIGKVLKHPVDGINAQGPGRLIPHGNGHSGRNMRNAGIYLIIFGLLTARACATVERNLQNTALTRSREELAGREKSFNMPNKNYRSNYRRFQLSRDGRS